MSRKGEKRDDDGAPFWKPNLLAKSIRTSSISSFERGIWLSAVQAGCRRARMWMGQRAISPLSSQALLARLPR